MDTGHKQTSTLIGMILAWRISKRNIVAQGALISVIMSACIDQARPSDPLAVYEIQPQVASPGSGISIVGTGFGIQGKTDQVTLSGEKLEVLYWSAKRIDLRLPAKMTTGAKWLVVSASQRVSRAIPFNVVSTTELHNHDEDLSDTIQDATVIGPRLRDRDFIDMAVNQAVDTEFLPNISPLPDQELSP